MYNLDRYSSFNEIFSTYQISWCDFVDSTKYNTIDKINIKLKNTNIECVVPLDRPCCYAQDAEYDTFMVLITSTRYFKITRRIVNNIEYLKNLICERIIIENISDFEYEIW